MTPTDNVYDYAFNITATPEDVYGWVHDLTAPPLVELTFASFTAGQIYQPNHVAGVVYQPTFAAGEIGP